MVNWEPLTAHVSPDELEKIQPAIDFVEGGKAENREQTNAVVTAFGHIRDISSELVGSALSKDTRNALFEEISLAMSVRRNALIGPPESYPDEVSLGEAFRRLCLSPEGAATGFGMIELHKNLVGACAGAHAKRDGRHDDILFSDMVEVGCYGMHTNIKGNLSGFTSGGLTAAFTGWKPEEGKFSTYAYGAVESIIKRFSQREPSATQHSVDRRRLPIRVPADISPLTQEGALRGRRGTMSARMFEDTGAADPSAVADARLLKGKMLGMIASLSPDEGRVIKLRYGLEDGTPKTLEEIETILGIDRETVRAIEAAALKKFQEPPAEPASAEEPSQTVLAGKVTAKSAAKAASLSVAETTEKSEPMVIRRFDGFVHPDSSIPARERDDLAAHLAARLGSETVASKSEGRHAPVTVSVTRVHDDEFGVFVHIRCDNSEMYGTVKPLLEEYYQQHPPLRPGNRATGL